MDVAMNGKAVRLCVVRLVLYKNNLDSLRLAESSHQTPIHPFWLDSCKFYKSLLLLCEYEAQTLRDCLEC